MAKGGSPVSAVTWSTVGVGQVSRREEQKGEWRKSRVCRCGRTKASVPGVMSESVTEPGPEEDRSLTGWTPAVIDLLTRRDSLCGLYHLGASLVLTGARKMGGWCWHPKEHYVGGATFQRPMGFRVAVVTWAKSGPDFEMLVNSYYFSSQLEEKKPFKKCKS